MKIRPAAQADLDLWAALRRDLWPEGALAEHRAEAEETLARIPEEAAVLLAFSEAGEALGFAEASLRRDYVNGCETSPVAFLEGIFVRPEARRKGVARALAQEIREWARARGCVELASDAAIGNRVSRALHAALGFEETEEVVFFRHVLAKE